MTNVVGNESMITIIQANTKNRFNEYEEQQVTYDDDEEEEESEEESGDEEEEEEESSEEEEEPVQVVTNYGWGRGGKQLRPTGGKQLRP